MKYLNIDILRQVKENIFLDTAPFPWTNPYKVLTDSGFDELVRTAPNVSLFKKSFDLERAYGQKSHDRYELMYKKGMHISPAWQTFITELQSPEYYAEVERLFGVRGFNVRFQWQYAVSGCSVSPHCDSKKKIGSHIFYLNTLNDWKESWGGQTIILDDNGRLDCESAPELEEFGAQYKAKTLGNYSLLFARTDHSWHTVEPLNAPSNAVRKIFTVVFEKKPGYYERVTKKVRGFTTNFLR